MAYVRKTKDYYEIQSCSNDGTVWSTESSNDTMKEAKRELKEYRENGYHNVRIKKVRIPITCWE